MKNTKEMSIERIECARAKGYRVCDFCSAIIINYPYFTKICNPFHKTSDCMGCICSNSKVSPGQSVYHLVNHPKYGCGRPQSERITDLNMENTVSPHKPKSALVEAFTLFAPLRPPPLSPHLLSQVDPELMMPQVIRAQQYQRKQIKKYKRQQMKKYKRQKMALQKMHQQSPPPYTEQNN